MKLSKSIPLSVLSVAALVFLTSVRGYASPVEQLKPVGSTTLKVFFWNIYDSTLFSPTGRYTGIEPGLALQIEYLRNIGKDRLIDTTREQWQELNLYQGQPSEAWLEELRNILPDIRRQDSLTLLVDQNKAATFYYNDEFIGRLGDPEFTEQFLAIWLAENSSYPKQRNELVGAL